MAESTYSVTLNDSNSWLLGSPGLVRPLLVGSQRWPAGGTWCWLAAVVVVLLILSVLLCVWMSGCGLAHSITQPDQTTAERRRLDKERIIMIGVHRHRVGESGFKERKDVRTGKEKKKRRDVKSLFFFYATLFPFKNSVTVVLRTGEREARERRRGRGVIDGMALPFDFPSTDQTDQTDRRISFACFCATLLPS